MAAQKYQAHKASLTSSEISRTIIFSIAIAAPAPDVLCAEAHATPPGATL
jgi:hypothetical protein